MSGSAPGGGVIPSKRRARGQYTPLPSNLCSSCGFRIYIYPPSSAVALGPTEHGCPRSFLCYFGVAHVVGGHGDGAGGCPFGFQMPPHPLTFRNTESHQVSGLGMAWPWKPTAPGGQFCPPPPPSPQL